MQNVVVSLPPGWSLHGTVTRNGATQALAWGHGMTGVCNAHGQLVTLTAIERSQINLAVEFHQQSGWESVPRSLPLRGSFRGVLNR